VEVLRSLGLLVAWLPMRRISLPMVWRLMNCRRQIIGRASAQRRHHIYGAMILPDSSKQHLRYLLNSCKKILEVSPRAPVAERGRADSA
jgi:hypothetical protein